MLDEFRFNNFINLNNSNNDNLNFKNFVTETRLNLYMNELFLVNYF